MLSAILTALSMLFLYDICVHVIVRASSRKVTTYMLERRELVHRFVNPLSWFSLFDVSHKPVTNFVPPMAEEGEETQTWGYYDV